MLELKVNVPELKDYAKNLMKIKENFFEFVRLDMKQVATDFLNNLLQMELEVFLGRDKYQRQSLVEVSKRNYRNGYYTRYFTAKGLGKIQVKIPRDRQGKYSPQVFEKYQRVETQLKEDMAIVFLMGTSTRNLSLISKRLLGTKVSHSQISQCSKSLVESVEKWRTREIIEEYKYLYLDGTNFKMRVGNSVEQVNLLVVIGVDKNGFKKVLAIQSGDKESAGSWRELFKDLKSRGLRWDSVKLGLMDGLPGLEKVFLEEFSKAKIQRCQVHVSRNVLCKVPRKLKQEVSDDVRSIFYANSKNKALEFFKDFESKWTKEVPSAVKCLKSSLSETLRYLDFPKEEWNALRTTNPIERLNKEFKRRTKSMEIVAGEQSCYNLLAVICLRMEHYWKGKPLKSMKELPWFKEEFTHKN